MRAFRQEAGDKPPRYSTASRVPTIGQVAGDKPPRYSSLPRAGVRPSGGGQAPALQQPFPRAGVHLEGDHRPRRRTACKTADAHGSCITRPAGSQPQRAARSPAERRTPLQYTPCLLCGTVYARIARAQRPFAAARRAKSTRSWGQLQACRHCDYSRPRGTLRVTGHLTLTERTQPSLPAVACVALDTGGLTIGRPGRRPPWREPAHS